MGVGVEKADDRVAGGGRRGEGRSVGVGSMERGGGGGGVVSPKG